MSWTRTKTPLPQALWFAWALILAGSVAACGSAPALPPAAEPGTSPPLSSPPAGTAVRVGPDAEGLRADVRDAVVAVGVSTGIVIVDEDGRLLRNVSLPAGPRHIAIAAPGGPLVVPAEGANQVDFVQPQTGAVSLALPVGVHPHDIASVGGRVFVGNELSSTISVIANNHVVATRPVVTQPGGLAAVGNLVAVVGVKARLLELLASRSLEAVVAIPCGRGPSHVVGFGRRLYVADTGGDALLEFDVSPHLRQVARLPLAGSPYGMDIDSIHQRLWVTLTATNRLVEYEINTPVPREVASYATVRQPNSVAVDPLSGRVFVAGAHDGVLQVLPPATSG